MKIYVIANEKGGVSKTTTAVNLAAALMERGKRVLLIDADPQQDLSFHVQAEEGKRTLADVLQHPYHPADVAIQTTVAGFDIIPGSLDLMKTGRTKQRLKLNGAEKNYDYVIIDLPPHQDSNTTAAIEAADGVIIPTTTDAYAYRAVAAIASSIFDLGGKIAGILITRDAGRLVLARQLTEDFAGLADELHTKIYNTHIRECVAAREASTACVSLLSYAPHSTAAEDYRAFADELLHDEEETK